MRFRVGKPKAAWPDDGVQVPVWLHLEDDVQIGLRVDFLPFQAPQLCCPSFVWLPLAVAHEMVVRARAAARVHVAVEGWPEPFLCLTTCYPGKDWREGRDWWLMHKHDVTFLEAA